MTEYILNFGANPKLELNDGYDAFDKENEYLMSQ
jgi:hypothetical protein